MRIALSILLATALSCGAEIIPSSNRLDWVLGSTVGVPGGIPTNRTVYTVLGTTSTAAQISTALQNCPSNQIVQLTNGTYSISGSIDFGTAARGVTLRGLGTNTILDWSGGGTTGIDLETGSETPSGGTAITSGYTRGSSNVTVSSASGLNVGGLIRIDQLFDTNIMWCTGSDPATVRYLGQTCRITAIDGTSITFQPPLHYGLTPLGDPKMWHYNDSRIELCGVEDLVMDMTDSTVVWSILMMNTYGCWVKDVRMTMCYNYAIYNLIGVYGEFSGVFVDDAPEYINNHGGIVVGQSGQMSSTAAAIYNCIFLKMLPGVEMNNASGCVIAYNYFRDIQYGTEGVQTVACNMGHYTQCMFNLYEGNICPMMCADGWGGGTAYDSVFRNWLTGWTESSTNYNSTPLSLCRWTIGDYSVGNVLGVTNFTPDYLRITNEGYGYEISTIYHLGYPQRGNHTYTNSRPPSTDRAFAFDTQVTNTLTIHGDWNSKTKEIQWDPDIADQTIPDSLYLTSKPSWFGNLTWPPFTASTGYTNLYWSSIPAGYRYLYGTNPPAGDAPPAAPRRLRVIEARVGTIRPP